MTFVVACAIAGALVGFFAVVGALGHVPSGWSVSALPPASFGFVLLPALAAKTALSYW